MEFVQYIGTSSIVNENTLRPGDVFIDIEKYTVSYMGSSNSLVPWTSVMDAQNTRHPLLNQHYILVPLQTRFSWLSISGIAQWQLQATDANPDNVLRVHIDRIRDAYARYSSNMDIGIGDDIDADGEMDYGTYC